MKDFIILLGFVIFAVALGIIFPIFGLFLAAYLGLGYWEYATKKN